MDVQSRAYTILQYVKSTARRSLQRYRVVAILLASRLRAMAMN